MLRVGRALFPLHRQMHTLSRDGPSETLKRKVAELEKMRKRKNPKKNQLFVEVPEPKTFLDTATMPMILTAVGVALFAKLLMMYDESKSQEMIERKIEHAPAGQGTVRMLTREEWEEIKEVRPRTPFESKLARPNARIRTGEPLHKVKPRRPCNRFRKPSVSTQGVKPRRGLAPSRRFESLPEFCVPPSWG